MKNFPQKGRGGHSEIVIMTHGLMVHPFIRASATHSSVVKTSSTSSFLLHHHPPTQQHAAALPVAAAAAAPQLHSNVAATTASRWLMRWQLLARGELLLMRLYVCYTAVTLHE
jgi:hypothetical protein